MLKNKPTYIKILCKSSIFAASLALSLQGAQLAWMYFASAQHQWQKFELFMSFTCLTGGCLGLLEWWLGFLVLFLILLIE